MVVHRKLKTFMPGWEISFPEPGWLTKIADKFSLEATMTKITSNANPRFL